MSGWNLQPLLAPRSIAIVGASESPDSWAPEIERSLRHHGYAGELYPINPKYDEVWGRPCLASIADLPKGVDLVSATGPSGACGVQGGKVTCNVGSLDPVGVNYGGAQVTVTIVVVPRVTGTIRNTATVKGDQKDPVNGNNKATASTRVLGAATCRGVAATVTGTAGDDVLLGTPGPDVIVGLGGSDSIVSRAGRDLICAGAGADTVGAGTAADRVFAGAGPDRLLGRGGPDLLKGSAGNDVLVGGGGADRLRGGRGIDRCRGGAGADSVRGCER